MTALRIKKLPRLSRQAAALLHSCLCIICAYLVVAAVYAKYACAAAEAQEMALMILHSGYISAVIATGGALVLDCDIRAAKR